MFPVAIFALGSEIRVCVVFLFVRSMGIFGSMGVRISILTFRVFVCYEVGSEQEKSPTVRRMCAGMVRMLEWPKRGALLRCA